MQKALCRRRRRDRGGRRGDTYPYSTVSLRVTDIQRMTTSRRRLQLKHFLVRP